MRSLLFFLLRQKLFWFGILLSSIFLVFLFRRISVLSLQDALQQADASWLGLAFLWMFPMMAFRSWRWTLLFGSSCPPSLASVWSPMMIGYFLNNLLPARLGEIIRAAALAQRLELPTSTVLATIFLERLTDALFLGLLLLVGMSFLTFQPHAYDSLLLFLTGLLLLALVTAFVGWQPERAQRAFELLLRPFPLRLRLVLLPIVSRFCDGLRYLRDPLRASGFFALTLLIWLGESFTLWLFLRGFSITLSYPAICFVMAVFGLGSILPSAPGQVGTFQMIAVSALGIFQIPAPQAFAFGIASHAILLAFFSLVGGWSFFRWQGSLIASFAPWSSSSPVPSQSSEHL